MTLSESFPKANFDMEISEGSPRMAPWKGKVLSKQEMEEPINDVGQPTHLVTLVDRQPS